MDSGFTAFFCFKQLIMHKMPLPIQDILKDFDSFYNWSSDLFDCGENASSCCYGFWCCPCLACTVSERFGENRCLPLCDICSPAMLAALGIPMCAAPPAGLSLRAAMRNRYGIKGSLCKDILVSCFCGWCNWCQMHRELRHREKTPTVVNTKTLAVSNHIRASKTIRKY
uniref:Cornifelin n=1 Tax=Sander lucioperca TaxID=283035 RepID=A0A8C9YHL2_SANLU